jgi:hypothetical protein
MHHQGIWLAGRILLEIDVSIHVGQNEPRFGFGKTPIVSRTAMLFTRG